MHFIQIFAQTTIGWFVCATPCTSNTVMKCKYRCIASGIVIGKENTKRKRGREKEKERSEGDQRREREKEEEKKRREESERGGGIEGKRSR